MEPRNTDRHLSFAVNKRAKANTSSSEKDIIDTKRPCQNNADVNIYSTNQGGRCCFQDLSTSEGSWVIQNNIATSSILFDRLQSSET